MRIRNVEIRNARVEILPIIDFRSPYINGCDACNQESESVRLRIRAEGNIDFDAEVGQVCTEKYIAVLAGAA
jgi:hypothetical protein